MTKLTLDELTAKLERLQHDYERNFIDMVEKLEAEDQVMEQSGWTWKEYFIANPDYVPF